VLVNVETALHRFCARILGWSSDRADAVEHAVRSIDLAVERSAALVLLGDTDLVPIAYALHRRTLGAAPFVVCDVRRADIDATVRSATNYTSGVAGFTAAQGGTLCLSYSRRPRDFSAVVALARNLSTTVQLMICGTARFDTHPFLVLPAPIRVPSLVTRKTELSRIVDEFVIDALKELGGSKEHFTAADRTWVLEHSPRTLGEIEKATRRIVALRMEGNVPRAADKLGMAPVSLARWFRRRKLPLRLEES